MRHLLNVGPPSTTLAQHWVDVSCLQASATLMTSQGSDTLTAILKSNSSNTITSLRLLKRALEIIVSISWHPSFLVGSVSVVFTQLAV